MKAFPNFYHVWKNAGKKVRRSFTVFWMMIAERLAQSGHLIHDVISKKFSKVPQLVFREASSLSASRSSGSHATPALGLSLISSTILVSVMSRPDQISRNNTPVLNTTEAPKIKKKVQCLPTKTNDGPERLFAQKFISVFNNDSCNHKRYLTKDSAFHRLW